MHRTLRHLALICALAILPLAQALPARATTVEGNLDEPGKQITAIKHLLVDGTYYDISFERIPPDPNGGDYFNWPNGFVLPPDSYHANGADISLAISGLLNDLNNSVASLHEFYEVYAFTENINAAGWIIPISTSNLSGNIHGYPTGGNYDVLSVGVPDDSSTIIQYSAVQCVRVNPYTYLDGGIEPCGFGPVDPSPRSGSTDHTVVTLTTNRFDFVSISPSPVPLPSTFALAATALSGLGLMGWRRRKKMLAM